MKFYKCWAPRRARLELAEPEMMTKRWHIESWGSNWGLCKTDGEGWLGRFAVSSHNHSWTLVHFRGIPVPLNIKTSQHSQVQHLFKTWTEVSLSKSFNSLCRSRSQAICLFNHDICRALGRLMLRAPFIFCITWISTHVSGERPKYAKYEDAWLAGGRPGWKSRHHNICKCLSSKKWFYTVNSARGNWGHYWKWKRPSDFSRQQFLQQQN